jgi:ferric-dicitrate binding protein FerR (iron transport regulator)
MKSNKGRLAESGKKAFIEENFSDQQWQSFKPLSDLPAGKSEEMLRAVHEGIAALSKAKQARKLKVVQLSRYLSAAAIVIVLSVALVLNYNNTGLKPAVQQRVATIKPSPAVKESIWKVVSNTGSSLRNIQLPDSSRVTIYPRSRIRYEKKFNHTFRNVYLKGKAKFKVRRNTSRPFSVYSGVLKTTALGTSFTINTAASGNRISVMLHTGRIVVKDTTVQHPLAYISTIGSTLLYNPEAKLVRVTNTKKRKTTPPEFLKREGDVIVMKNIPLAEVIRLLNGAYKIQILARSADIAAITFTGQVDVSKDQIEDVLNMICTINNMTLTQASPKEFNIQKVIK